MIATKIISPHLLKSEDFKFFKLDIFRGDYSGTVAVFSSL